MNTYAQELKSKLFSIIDQMEPKEFVHSPKSSFKRNRKLPFSTMLRLILSLGSSSLNQELLQFFQYQADFPSASAFVQQRQKIKPEAFSYLFHEFNRQYSQKIQLYHDYRLLAVDGSSLVCPLNLAEDNAYPDMKCSLLHLNAIFDLLNKQFVDAIVQSKAEFDEIGAAVEMTNRLSDQYPVILVADRGYESYNFFAHIEERLFDYVVRIKNSSVGGIFQGIGLPKDVEFDVTKNLVITRNSTGPYAVNPKKYKYMTKKARFDFIPSSKHPDYEITIRFVQFQLSSGQYELLATSLTPEEFTIDDLKEVYNLRWGIESSFRELKHAAGLSYFHTKKADCVIQEVFARLILFNFSMCIANKLELSEKNTKHVYQPNYTQAIRLCLYFLRLMNNSPPLDLKALLLQMPLPQRKGRSYTRKVHPQGAKAFNYRLT